MSELKVCGLSSAYGCPHEDCSACVPKLIAQKARLEQIVSELRETLRHEDIRHADRIKQLEAENAELKNKNAGLEHAIQDIRDCYEGGSTGLTQSIDVEG